MKPQLSKAHIENLQFVDALLGRVYKDGSNSATYAEMFTGGPDTETSKLFMVYFLNPNGDEKLKCLEFLKDEGLLIEFGDNYHLTFKGILRATGNTFEAEYRNTIAANTLVYNSQTSTILRNNVSIVLSIVAIIVSIIALTKGQ